MSDQQNGGFRGNKDGNQGQKRSFSGSRPANRDGKPSFGGNQPANRGGKPSFGGKRPANRDGKPSFGGNQPANRDGKPSFGGDRPANRGERTPFRGDATQNRGEKPGFGGNRPARPAGKPGLGGNKVGDRPYSERKPGGDRAPRTMSKPWAESKGRPAADRAVKSHPAQQEGLASRRLALEVIREVTENDAYLSLSLDAKLHACGLPVVDRRLAARLVYDTIENRMYLDHVLNQVMAKPDTDIKLRNILRLGACQILLEDRIPESAACNTSVMLCKELGMEGLAGVCNGVLRNLIRQKDELNFPNPEAEPVKALSIRHSVPEWLVETLLADWGDEAIDLMSTRNHDSYITVRPNMTRMDDAAFEAFLKGKVWEFEAGKVAHSWRIRNMAEIAHDAGFVGGQFSIQSESSMMAAMAVDPKRGMQILDCCAAPGGKSCLMAEMMQGTGRVQAWELHEHRTNLITAQVTRLGLENVRTMTRDALKPRPDLENSMDAVLLDAPCSGLGVMADKPDVKYRVTPESVKELVGIQARLLDTVAPYVKRGGTLVYSTCSVLKDENARQAEAFLRRHPEFELLPLPESIPAQFRQHEGADGAGLQLLPDRDGVEGFYICRMRRKRV